MQTLFTDDFETILGEASDDEYINNHFIFFSEEEDYKTLAQFFEKTNYAHYDWDDELVTPDTKKILKKILRGKDTISLIQFALELGRLIGRAEQILSTRDHD